MCGERGEKRSGGGADTCTAAREDKNAPAGRFSTVCRGFVLHDSTSDLCYSSAGLSSSSGRPSRFMRSSQACSTYACTLCPAALAAARMALPMGLMGRAQRASYSAGADAVTFGVVNIVVAALAFGYGHGQSSFSGSSGQSVRSITMISGGCGVSL